MRLWHKVVLLLFVTVLAPAAPASEGERLEVALKYVAYADTTGQAVATRAEIEDSLRVINQIWSPCRLGFTLEKFQVVNPSEFGLPFQTAHYSDLTKIRRSFSESNTLLVVITGKWNRTGSLGNTGANAWTTLPGGGPFGTVVERSAGINGNLVAHELGHYLNLEHVADEQSVMNPVIYRRSTRISDEECEASRSTLRTHWSQMTRNS